MHLSPLAKMALLLLPLSAAGQTGMQGNVCVQALQPGASCLASDRTSSMASGSASTPDTSNPERRR